jgi:DNA-binding transcriptional ArsR family regulator
MQYAQIVTTQATLQVLAEPNRFAIVDFLRDGERPVGDVVRQLRLSQPTVSKHLRVLKDAGLVEVRSDAQRRLYSIRTEPMDEIAEWLETYRELWTTRLNRLEDHLEKRRKK